MNTQHDLVRKVKCEEMTKEKVTRRVTEKQTKNRCLREKNEGTEGKFEGEGDKWKEEESKKNITPEFPSHHRPG